MAVTNFAALTNEQLTVWSRDIWKAARNMSFISRFTGSGTNSMIQRITELKKTEKGARAVITLVADLEDDGVIGDNQLEGNEEEIKSYDQVINIDQIRNANRHKGRLADQKSVVNFREQSRDVLAYWLADRMDQLAFLTLSGVNYSFTNRGAARSSSAFANLEFNLATAPSANRWLRWELSSTSLKAGATASVAAADIPTYEMLVKLKAYAKENYVRGIKGPGGEEFYHVFMTPTGMAHLRLDSDYQQALRNAGVRGSKNELFAGASSVMIDGLVIHEYRHVYNTTGAAGGSKWGGSGTVDGQACLFCGAQAMGMADIGNPYWVEKEFDYNNQPGISVGKMLGFLKPQFHSNYSGTTEDFGVIRVDTAI